MRFSGVTHKGGNLVNCGITNYVLTRIISMCRNFLAGQRVDERTLVQVRAQTCIPFLAFREILTGCAAKGCRAVSLLQVHAAVVRRFCEMQ